MPTASPMLRKPINPCSVLTGVTGELRGGKLLGSAGTGRVAVKASNLVTGW